MKRPGSGLHIGEIGRGMLATVLVLLCASGPRPEAQPALHGPEPAWTTVVPGVEWTQFSDPTWLEPNGPVRVFALRIDSSRARVASALAEGRTPALETVASLAARVGAVAAVNAGFFGANGRPAGVLKQGGQWIGASGERARGAVGFIDTPTATRVVFGQVRAALTVHATARGARSAAGRRLGVRHLHPTGRPPGLSLYAPAFGDVELAAPLGDAKAPPVGVAASATLRPPAPFVAFACAGTPCRVSERVARVPRGGMLPIPADGLVVVARGAPAIRAVRGLTRGSVLRVVPTITVERGDRDGWAEARDIMGGVGLLLKDGQRVTDWTPERFRAGFDIERHPRTLIGVDRRARIWLVVVDGRRPEWSLGMRFDELQALAERLDLIDVLNLDGGGSTTMVIKGDVVNRPTDLVGPRRVSDAIVVTAP